MFKQTLLFTLILLLSHAKEEQCIWKPNTLPLIQGNMVLQATVPNGQKYLIGDLNDDNKNYLYVAKLKGSSYQMGKAYGQLFKEELKQQLDLFYQFVEADLNKKIQSYSFPPFLAKFLIKNSITGLNSLLDLDVMVTKRYTHPRYAQQIKGIADGAGFGLKSITRLNIFPEFIKAACSAVGIWKQASAFNHTLHMRALDWEASSPINKFPIITVYHPNEKGAIKHANLGYVGFVGVLTGLSEKISIGEKVWIVKNPVHSVKTTRFGNPWTYVLRDILYQAHNMTQAIKILTKTPRTCTIHLGIASVQEHNFRMFLYAQNVLQNYNDVNYTHYTVNHTQRNGIAYFNKHVQPNNDPCMSNTITNSTYYGNWDMESFWRVIGGVHETGDTQLVVFDLERQELLISYSHNFYNQSSQKHYSIKAYNRSPIHIKMSDFWRSF